MGLGTVVLLAVDMALMGAILFLLMSRRPVEASGADVREQKIVTEMRQELLNARKAISRIEEERKAIEAHEKSLLEKERKLEVIIKRAKENLDSAGTQAEAGREDIYMRAQRMLNKGTPAEEIIKRLGLMNGEAELLASLNTYKN